MKRNILFFAGLGLAVLCACRCPSGGDGYCGAAAKVAPRHVIFVGFDGLAGNLVERSKTPTMDRLMREGAWTLESRSILPSASACNWHSLFTASASEQHGFKAWNSQVPAFPPMEVGENGRYPDIFYLLRKARPKAEIGLAYEWSGIAHCVDTNACRTVAVGKADVLTDVSCAYIREKKPDFFAVCYNDPDSDGHGHGWGSSEYIAAVERQDANLARILRAVTDAGILDETVVVVSSDHGGVNRVHGGATTGEMNRPVFIVGKGVVRGRHLSFPGTIYDTGATLAALLNIRPARSWIGRPHDEAFEKDVPVSPCVVREEKVLYEAGATDAPVTATGGVFSVAGRWDLSPYGEFVVEFAEPIGSDRRTTVSVLMENAGAQPPDPRGDRSKGAYQMNVTFCGETNFIVRPIPPRMPEFEACVEKLNRVRVNGLFSLVWPNVYWGRQGAGWNNEIKAWTLDPSSVVRVSVIDAKGKRPPVVKRIAVRGPVNHVVACPEFARMPAEKFFPFVDKFGQFKWRDWPGKIHSEQDLQTVVKKEDEDLAAHPGPADRDKWGGWTKGPRFEATGSFTVRKVDGKWWFVDPDGCLWWSHGPVRVSASTGMTDVKGRENYFDFLPKADSPFAAFYRTRDELLWPYYVKWGYTNTYDFTSANLYRKYGEDWQNVWADRVHRRLRSWGANTIANSSDARVMRLSRTPYCDRFELKSRPIEGTVKLGSWWPFRDPFDPSFRADVRRQMEAHKAEMEDPWCFGFFVDNELPWGLEGDLARWTWESPDDQPAKVEFKRRLAAKYGKVPETPFEADFREFTLVIVNAYFANVRDEFKKVAPQKLYMGCRFSGDGSFLAREAAKYVDVMSFNYYKKDVKEFPKLEGIDRPIIVGEFHFGALDRGPIFSGIIQLRDQAERGMAYRRYVTSALEDPRFVGVHWHQYADDVATGRFDGENFQIGWVDVCDTPYPEMVDALRWVGDNMYRIRSEGKVK